MKDLEQLLDRLDNLKEKSAQLQPDPAVKQRLLAQFPSVAPIPFWKKPIPAWAVAASCIGTFVFCYELFSARPLPYSSVVQHTVHDTVYQEKIIHKEKIIYLKGKKEIIYLEKENNIDSSKEDIAPIFANRPLLPHPIDNDELDIKNYLPQGQSLADDSLTWVILTKMK